MDDGVQKREADQAFVRRVWSLLLQRKAPLWAALGILIVFSFRVAFCSYTSSDSIKFRWYGNHCGPGHGTGDPAIDELDEECQKHDEAYRKTQETN